MEYVTFETERYGRKYRTQRIRCNNHDELMEYRNRYGFTSGESDIEYLEGSGYPIYMEIIKDQWILNRIISACSSIGKDDCWTEVKSVPIRPIYKVVE